MTELEQAQSAPLLSEEERSAFLEFIEMHRGEQPAVSIRSGCEYVLGLEPTPPGQRRPHNKEWSRVTELKMRVDRLIAREPAFAEAYATARGYGQDQIRNRLSQVAMEGVDEVTRIVGPAGEIVEERVTKKADNRILALMARARLPEHGDHATVQITGPGGGAIQVEDRSARLEEVYAVLAAVGSRAASAAPAVIEHDGGGDARRALPAARDVLAEPEVGESAADGVPPAA